MTSITSTTIIWTGGIENITECIIEYGLTHELTGLENPDGFPQIRIFGEAPQLALFLDDLGNGFAP